MLVIALLVLAGLLLLLLETILPGLIAGAVGLVLLGIAVVYGYTEFGVRAGNTTLLVVMVALFAGAVLWVKYFPDSAAARLFVSKGAVGNVGAEKPELLGQAGVAVTDLRPAGMALISGKRVDVVTEGGFVRKGADVKVIRIEGMRVVVRAAPEGGSSEKSASV